MSNDHKKFLKEYKFKKYLIHFYRILLLAIFIILWELLSKYNIINSFIFSSPSRIINTIKVLFIENNLLNHIFVTLNEILIAFIITCFISLFIAIILYYNNFLYKVFEPFLLVINSLPKVALGPIIIIWIGANNKSVITISILISIIVSILNIYDGFNKTDSLKIKLMNTFNSSKKDLLFKLIIPSNKQTILNAFRINISMCLIGVITGEFLTSKAGIGYLIMYGSQVFNLDLVLSGIFILLILSYAIYIIVNKIFS